MVARGVRRHRRSRVSLQKSEYGVGRPSELEGARSLLVLALEEDLEAELFIEAFPADHRRPEDPTGDPPDPGTDPTDPDPDPGDPDPTNTSVDPADPGASDLLSGAFRGGGCGCASTPSTAPWLTGAWLTLVVAARRRCR